MTSLMTWNRLCPLSNAWVFGACREWLSDRRRAPAERLLRFFQNKKVSAGAATSSSFVVRQSGVFSLLFACASNVAFAEHQTGWIDHGGDRGGSRFSALGLINRDNVRQLRMVWTYRTGDGAGEMQAAGHAGLQATPIALPEAAGNLLVLCTSFNAVVALDPANGRERWRFDPKVRRDRAASDYRCRGVSQWRDSELDITAACALRIFVATHDQRLYALDGLTGKSCAGFGDQGLVRLAPVIRESASATDGEEVRSHMPPAVVGNVVAVGTSFGPKLNAAAPGGEVHGFDARTGALRWSFDPLVDSADTTNELPAPHRISSAARGRATIRMRIRPWRCAALPVKWYGHFRRCITMSGVAMPCHNPCSLIFVAAPRRCLPWCN